MNEETVFVYEQKDLPQETRQLQFSGDKHIPTMNVSAEADRAYCEEKGLLQTESYEEWIIDPPNPAAVAHRPKVARLLHNGTAEEWVKAIVEYASSDGPKREAGKVISFPVISIPTGGARYCANESNGKHIMPSDARANALYCDQACKKAAYRSRTSIGKS